MGYGMHPSNSSSSYLVVSVARTKGGVLSGMCVEKHSCCVATLRSYATALSDTDAIGQECSRAYIVR